MVTHDVKQTSHKCIPLLCTSMTWYHSGTLHAPTRQNIHYTRNNMAYIQSIIRNISW